MSTTFILYIFPDLGVKRSKIGLEVELKKLKFSVFQIRLVEVRAQPVEKRSFKSLMKPNWLNHFPQLIKANL